MKEENLINKCLEFQPTKEWLEKKAREIDHILSYGKKPKLHLDYERVELREDGEYQFCFLMKKGNYASSSVCLLVEWFFNELEISEDEHGKCVKMNGKVVSR